MYSKRCAPYGVPYGVIQKSLQVIVMVIIIAVETKSGGKGEATVYYLCSRVVRIRSTAWIEVYEKFMVTP